MNHMFSDCYSLLCLPDITKWNISNVKYMFSIFENCKSLIKVPDIPNWNESKLKNISYLFF